MIYTVTFNPSLDYILTVPGVQLGKTNRARTEQLFPGGKGINVSMILRNLGVESTALGFVAGFTGDELVRKLNALHIQTDFIGLSEGMTRINVKVKSHEETEINAVGPYIDKEALQALFTKLETLQSGDVLFLSGSIPMGLPDTIYQDIMARLQEKGVLIVVDATKDLLRNVLQYKPFLIKPNHHELGELFGTKITSKEEAAFYAKKLQQLGARNVLVSMAGDGAVFVSEDGCILESKAPKGEVVSSVGAGDAMLAGFMAEWLSTKNYEKAFLMGLAAGSATAFSAHMASGDKIREVLAELKKIKGIKPLK